MSQPNLTYSLFSLHAVCLERLEPSASGIVTTVCNHRFHNQCLRQWVDSSCPVCRYVQGGDCGVGGSAVPSPSLECAHDACRSTVDLWMCLICGHTGCGRYRGSHAAKHFEETGHGFALEVADGRGVRTGRQGSELVWDYRRDAYVHRLGAEDSVERGDVERFEDPGVTDESSELEKAVGVRLGGDGEVKSATRSVDAALVQAKLDSLATELTQLMVSQMEMQRAHYEKIVESHHRATERALEDTNAAAAVAVAASAAADAAAQKAEQATQKPRTLGEAGKEPQGAVVLTGTERDAAQRHPGVAGPCQGGRNRARRTESRGIRAARPGQGPDDVHRGAGCD